MGAPRVLLIISLAGLSLHAQARAAAPAFEVAAINPNKAGKDFPALHSDPGRLTVTNMTLKSMLAIAYLVREDQILGGPGWLDSDRYDVAAKAEQVASQEEQRQMLRTLLIDRFKLQVRQTAKDVPGFDLVVAKNGPKLRPAKPDLPSNRRFGKGFLGLQGGTMEMFAKLLSSALSRPVTDLTGIKGTYDVRLEFTPEDYHPAPVDPSKHEPSPPDPNGPSIFAALQEQLGLKLQSRTGPAEVLVIEHAQRPTQN